MVKNLSIHRKRMRIFIVEKIKKDVKLLIQRLIWFRAINRFRQENRNVNAIFIVGCGHSGTSLLNKILSTHTEIHSIGGESKIFDLESRNILQIMSTLNSWISDMEKVKKRAFVEKTPSHVHNMKFIRLLFQNSKILLITRNPLDNIASLHKRYNDLNRATFRYLVDNWEGLRFSSKVHHLKYENLVTDFDGTLLDVQSYCNVNPEDLSNYYNSKAFYYSTSLTKPESYSQKTHSATRNYQINQPIMDTRGQYFQILNKEQIKSVKGQVFSISDKLDYTWFIQESKS